MPQDGRRSTCSVQLLLVLPLVLLQCHRSSALPKELADELQKIWEDNRHLTDDDVAQLRQDSWNMFNKGFTNYMALAFPKDNLLPVSCAGENWQGGMAVTLLDALDSLMMMGRLSDMRAVLPMIKEHVDFRKPIKVHVFEVVIRVVGGLLSGHSLLQRAADIIPEYDGVLLDLATQLAEAMLPAFHTPSGLPFQFTNLKTGPVTDVRTTCTACVGTLLLEYGTLSALHGDPRWRQLAEHAAHALYARRSSLGLVGSSLDVGTSTWVSREATIGPGSDSFYEYMLKSYLMFGNRTHLEMFTNLYTSAMRHLQVPGTLRGYSFLADVHMDSGRMSRPFVSSLGAFWPGMQALVGQLDDAIDLHANFTAAWQLWGWLPELFGLDLARVHPEDPGYNLRPEHIESTFMLYAQTGQHKYRKIAARMQRTLEAANQAACGYTSVSNVETGAQNDLQESFFLSETVKYLYLSFTPHAPHLLDYYVLSTEGHILPTFPPNNSLQEAEEEGDLARVRLEGLPPNCVAMCEPIDEIKQAAIEAGLRQSFPLLSFRRAEAVAIKRRRCIACVAVTKHMAAHPPASVSARTRIMQLNADLQSHGALSNNKALAQAVCVLRVSRQGAVSCHVLRPIVAHDIQHGLPHNAVVLQLTWVENTAAAGLLLVTPITPQDKASLILPASTATFGGSLLEITPNCIRHLYNVTWPWMRATAHANRTRHCPAPPVRSHDPGARTRAAWRHLLRTYTARTAKPTLPELSVPGLALSHQVLAAQQGQVSSCQAHKEKPSSTAKSTSTAVDSPPDPNPEPNPNSATSPDPIPDTNPAPSPLLSPEEGQGRVHPVIQTLPDTASCKVAAQRAIPQSATTISTKTTITTTISANGAQAAAAGQPTTHVVTSTITTSTAVGGHEPACVAVEEALGAEVLLLDPSNSDPTLVDTVKDEAMLESFEEDQTLKACPMLADSSGTPGGARLAVPLDIMTDQPGPVQTEVQAEVPPGVQAPDTKTTPEAPRISEECVDESDAEADTRFDDPHVTGPCKTVPVPYGELVLASPLFACSSEFSNAAMLSGSVAVVVRGGCSFATKALAVQAAGAHAMVVLDLHGTDQELLTMSGDVGMTSHAVRIPALLVGGAHSRTLLRAMRDAALAGQPRLVASLSLDPNQPGDGASGSVPSHDGVSPSRGTTSIYMLVPTNSHAYVKANLLERGMDMQTLLDAVLQDERVMLLLMQIAKENEATLAAQAASMGMGAGTA